MKFSIVPEQDEHAPLGKVYYVRMLAQEGQYQVMYEHTDEFEYEIDARRFVKAVQAEEVVDLADWIEVEPLYETICPN